MLCRPADQKPRGRHLLPGIITMNPIYILNTSAITDGEIKPRHTLVAEDGKITALLPNDAVQELPPQAQMIDANGAYAAPAFIDLHIHGLAGHGPENASEEDLLQMSLALAGLGVGAFCPTLYCATPQQMLHILRATSGAFGKEKGAKLLGFHLEGPFISPAKPGVMKPQDILPPDAALLPQLYEAARGHITNITLAPELAGLEGIISFCKEHHILIQAGHTNATYEEFMAAARQGVTHATHMFNAMSPFTHRAPGAAGAVLMHPEISCEIIADGVHVHPDVVSFLGRVKPPQNIALVTDALKPTAQPQGPFIANGETVVLEGGVWRRKTDKVIAGSALTMLKGVENLTRFGFTLPQAAACASAVPARLLGLTGRGTLTPGAVGDIVLFDKQFKLIATLLHGQVFPPAQH